MQYPLQTITSYLLLLLLTHTILSNIYHLLRNIRLARASNLPYRIVPVNTYNRLFSLLGARLLTLLERPFPPPASPTSWRWLIRASWPWRIRYAPFAAMGADTFLTVAPGGCILYTADADVIRQILVVGGGGAPGAGAGAGAGAGVGRGMSDFPKPGFLYRSVDIFGKNVVTTEGHAWRRHRRVVAPALGERNNRLVWEETVRQMVCLVRIWSGGGGARGGDGGKGNVVETVQRDAMTLSLNVIGRAGFGQDMGLPGEKGKERAPEGHAIGFATALATLTENIIFVVAVPGAILRWGPKSLRPVYNAYTEFRQYMREMLAEKRSEIESLPDTNSARSNLDLLGQILKGQDLLPTPDEKEIQPLPDAARGLTDSEALGNLFVLLFAGHETTAGTLHFILILLAIHPWYQKWLQHALDDIVPLSNRNKNNNSIEEESHKFNYDNLLPKLLANPFITAVVNETLRVLGPVPTIPKWVPPNSPPQTLIVNGKEASVPPGTMIKLCAACVHRNPKYWPHDSLSPSPSPSSSPSSKPETVHGDERRRSHWKTWKPSNPENDLEGFRPDRWLEKRDAEGEEKEEEEDKLISLPFGAFIPFSEGPRSCLGKRFAQVELLAAIAVLFSRYSVELAVDELVGGGSGSSGGCDERVGGVGERRRLWELAAEKANVMWREKSSMIITLQLRGDRIPIRLVDRGKEEFWWDAPSL